MGGGLVGVGLGGGWGVHGGPLWPTAFMHMHIHLHIHEHVHIHIYIYICGSICVNPCI